MKQSMKRRLQSRFVLLAVAALLVLQAGIVAFSIGSSYRRMTTSADRLILLAATDADSPELGDARYFRVIFHPEERTFETDALVTQGAALEYAKGAIASGADSGYAGHYRYLVYRGESGIHITFLSRYEAVEAFRDNAKAMLLISAAGVLGMALLLAAVSGMVVSPLVKNRQRQKEFITSASHGLKTPLAVIQADAQLLEAEIGENEWLSDILKQTASMTEMTQRLVYLARAEEQDNHFVKIEFPISDVAEDIADSYRSLAQSSEKTYTLEIQEGLSCCGDEKAIREMMTALLDNAFKYSAGSGDIAVRLAAEGKGVRFTVENAVSDIDPKQLGNYTERFYRADTSDRIKGFGIGLSLVRVVAEAHKGKLSITLPEKDRIRISAILK